MQNLLEIQNALRSASEQQLIGLLQNPTPTVPQWAVVSQMNTNKEMLDEQTRQQGLGQSTILEKQLETPQVNVAGMPQDAASNMGQNIAPKTDVAQNTGIASVAPVATMASGGVLKMGLGGDLDAQFILTDIPELGIRVGQFIKVSAETLEKLNNTLPKIMAKYGDKVASVQSYVDDGYRGLASAAREGDALIPTRVKKYIENTSPAPEVAKSRTVRDAIREQLAGTYSKNLAGGTGESSLETLIRKSMPASQTEEISGDPYAGDIFSDDRIRFRPRENVGGGIEAQDAANPFPITVDATKPVSKDDIKYEVAQISQAERNAQRRIMKARNDRELSDYLARTPEDAETMAETINAYDRQFALDNNNFPTVENFQQPFVGSSNGLIIPSKNMDQRSGLERLEAENEENLPEDMKQQLRINSYARAGRTAAEIADLLGVSAGKVLDVAAGTLSAGLLETTALGADVMSAYQAGVMGNTDSGMFYANAANKIKQFSDDTFSGDNKLPRLSTALNIPTNAEADAAAAAEQTSAMDAKIMAMPDDSSVFAEGAPVEYTPAGLAAIQARKDELNREYGPADEVGNTIKTDMGINLDNLIREENAATAREGSFGLIPQVPKENVINNRFNFTDNEDGLPAPAPILTTPAQMRESAEFMSRDAAGIGGYADGIPTQYEGQDKIGTPNVTLKQQAELSDASLDNLNTTAGDIQPPVPAPAPGFPPDGNYFLNKNLMEVYKSRARKAARDDAFKGTSTGPDEYLGDMYPDPEKTLKPKDATDTTSNAGNTNTSGAGAGANASAGSKSGSAGGYQDRLASILDRMEARKDEDKWMSLADMGLRLMGSKNPNFLGAVGESGLGALQGYRQQQGANQKQEIGILGKLGDFDMAERTLQARMAIANASAAGSGGAKAKDILAVLEARRAELTGPLAPTDLSPSEQVAKDAALADIDRQIGALTGVTINSTPQAVQADASDDVSFIDRIFG